MIMLKKLTKLLSTLILVHLLTLETKQLYSEEIFKLDDNCLAYRTEETILLFIDSIVVGKTCEISTQVYNEAGNTKFIVTFPINSLDSGLEIRDKDVMEMLSVESNSHISFFSDFLSAEQISEALTLGKINLGGMLEIAGMSYKVNFPLKLEEYSGKWLVTGIFVSSLSKFGLELPSVFGGIIADTRDYLELHVHLRFILVQGMPEFNS